MTDAERKPCQLCGQVECHPLCPQRHIETDANRFAALKMGVPVATSDWVDVLLAQLGVKEPTEQQRTIATEVLSMHHRFVDRTVTEAIKEETERVFERDKREQIAAEVDAQVRAAIEHETEVRVRAELGR